MSGANIDIQKSKRGDWTKLIDTSLFVQLPQKIQNCLKVSDLSCTLHQYMDAYFCFENKIFFFTTVASE